MGNNHYQGQTNVKYTKVYNKSRGVVVRTNCDFLGETLIQIADYAVDNTSQIEIPESTAKLLQEALNKHFGSIETQQHKTS